MNLYNRFESLLTEIQMNWRLQHIVPNFWDVFAFVRWVLRIIAYLMVIIVACSFVFRLSDWNKTIEDIIVLIWKSPNSTVNAIPKWVGFIKVFVAVLFGIGIGGSIIRIFRYFYDFIQNDLATSPHTKYNELLLWLFSSGISMFVISILFWQLDTVLFNWFEIFQAILWITLTIILFSIFIGCLALFAFPSLSTSIPLSLGYRRSLESRNQTIIRKAITFCKENFSNEELQSVESLIHLRLEGKGHAGSGLEISVGLLGVALAIISFLPDLGNEPINLYFTTVDTTNFFPVLVGVIILGLIWYVLNLRSIKGEELHILTLAAQACILAQNSELEDQEPQNTKTQRRKSNASSSISRIEEFIILDEQKNSRSQLREFVVFVKNQGLFVQSAQNALAFMPSTNYRRPLFLIYGKTTSDNKISMILFPKVFASYYETSEADIISSFGSEGLRQLTSSDFEDFIVDLKLFLNKHAPIRKEGKEME